MRRIILALSILLVGMLVAWSRVDFQIRWQPSPPGELPSGSLFGRDKSNSETMRVISGLPEKTLVIYEPEMKQPENPLPEFAGLSFQDFLNLRDQATTSLQAELIHNRVIGKRVSWEGWVKNVIRKRGRTVTYHVTVAENPYGSRRQFLVEFQEDRYGELLPVNKGDKVGLVCLVDDSSGDLMVLNHCDPITILSME